MIIHTLVRDSCFYSDEQSGEVLAKAEQKTRDKARIELSDGKISAIFSTNPKDFLSYKLGDKFKG